MLHNLISIESHEYNPLNIRVKEKPKNPKTQPKNPKTQVGFWVFGFLISTLGFSQPWSTAIHDVRKLQEMK